MLLWRFFIKNNDLPSPEWVEIDEPIGWDAVEFSLTRSINSDGLESVFSSELQFYDDQFRGKTLLNEAFNIAYFDANVDLRIESNCEDSIFGYLNFMTYENIGNTVSLQFEESSFSRKFKSRLETVVNLDNPIGIDGQALSVVSREEVRLHSKKIIITAKGDNDTSEFNIDNFEYRFNYPNDPPYISPPNQLDGVRVLQMSDYDDCEQIFSNFFIQWGTSQNTIDYSLIDYFNLPNASVCINTSGTLPSPNARVKYSGNLKIRIPIDMAAWVWTYTNGTGLTLCDCDPGQNPFGINHFDYQLIVKVGANQQSVGLSSGDRENCGELFFGDIIGKNTSLSGESEMISTLERPFDPSEEDLWGRKVRFKQDVFEFDFDATAGDDITIYVACNIDSSYETGATSPLVWIHSEAYIGPNQGLEIELTSTAEPTTTTGFKVYEALNRTVESITGRNDAIRSNYFGRTNSIPYNYDEDGCESQILYTNGKSLRNLKKEDGTNYAINVTFQDLFNDLSQKRCLGYRIDRIGGIDYVRIEPIEYFYSQESILILNDVANIRTEVAKSRLYNDLEIGYNKWEIENLNGIDEFNTKHNYTVATTNIKQKLTAVTNYIAGGYAIEMTRRLQQTESITTDWKYDDDIFCIGLNRIQVESDLYGEGLEVYAPGEVSERNELFEDVQNVISPETSYNLRFSPARSAMYWFKKMAPSLLKKANQSLKFQSGTGNILLFTDASDEDLCKITVSGLQENQDIEASATIFETLDRISLYEPIWISFEYPLSYSQFTNIRDNSNKAITAICEGIAYNGYVEEINFKPNIEDGKADFKLLVGYCYLGEFDNSFSDDFNTGTC